MSYPRKWKDKALGTFNTERAKLNILRDLEIEITHACNIGIDNCIKDRVESGKAPAHVVKAWADIFKAQYEELKTYIKLLEGNITDIESIQNTVKAETERLDQVVRVYDSLEEHRVNITVREFEGQTWRYKKIKPGNGEEGENDP
jgi:hypothetical protein